MHSNPATQTKELQIILVNYTTVYTNCDSMALMKNVSGQTVKLGHLVNLHLGPPSDPREIHRYSTDGTHVLPASNSCYLLKDELCGGLTQPEHQTTLSFITSQ